MRHLNYSHLLYFWTVAREGSIASAGHALHLTPQTISGQLKRLDEAVGAPLFARAGRRLVLSETGRMVFQYADEIFALGAELADVVRGQAPGMPRALDVGIVDSIPKLVSCRVLEPALGMSERMRVNCRESDLDELLSALAAHRLDLVLSDRPVPAGLRLRAYHHLLGTSGVTFFARPKLAARFRRGFPESLRDAPFLLPAGSLPLRRQLEEWFDSHGIAPAVVGDFADSGLLNTFGQCGAGVFAAPTAIEREIRAMHRVAAIGRTDAIQERFYAISPERKLKHPAVVAITERARQAIFQDVEAASAAA